jgi:O-antigen/teichoic acid export membrane protein
MKILPGLSRKGLLQPPRISWGLDRSLLKNAFFIFGVNISPGLVGLVYWAAAGRWFLPEEIGLASSVISIVTLLAGFGALGLGYGLLRFLPQAGQPQRLLNSTYTFSTGLSTAAGIAFLSCSGWLFPELSLLGEGSAFQVVFLLFIVSVALGSLVRDTFVASRQASYAWTYTLLAALARPIMLLPFVSSGSVGLVASSALAFGLALVASMALFLPRVQPGYRPCIALSRVELARLLPYSSGNYVVVLLAQLSQTVLPLLVLKQLGPAASGYTFVALMIAGLVAAPGIALSTSALVESASDPRSVDAILRQAAGLGMPFSLAAGGLLYLLAPWLLLVFGPPYAEQAAPLLRLLALSTPLFVLIQFYYARLRFEQKTRRLVLLSGLLVVLTLVPVWVCLPIWGIKTVGIGSLFANALLCGLILLNPRSLGQEP